MTALDEADVADVLEWSEDAAALWRDAYGAGR